jgi:endonuclease V-like protein UPF0215 family
VKKKITILALDDGAHREADLMRNRIEPTLNPPSTPAPTVPLVGVVCKGLQLIYADSSRIEVDGTDSTSKILSLYHNCPMKAEIRLILIDSPTMGGFNIVDPYQIHEETHLPVVLVPDSFPKEPIASIYPRIFPTRSKEIAIIEKLAAYDTLDVTINSDMNITGKIAFHCIGTTKAEVAPVLHHLAEYSLIPEPLRLAHILASSGLFKNK